MKEIIQRISKTSTHIMLLSIVLGILLPQAGETMKPYILPLLAVLLFLVGLKVDLKQTMQNLRKPKPLLFLIFVNVIIMPPFFYLLSSFLMNEIQIIIGFVLFGATSVAVSSSMWTMLTGGDVELALSTTVINALIVPITLPLTVYLFFQTSIEFDVVGNFNKLLLTVVMPLL
jgi:BASS family bile acid:Na+ symporter